MANNHPNSLPPPSFRRIRSQTWPQENDDDIDLEELIASLPKEKGFIIFPGVHSFCRHFTAHDSDIILACKPKSGTTWLKALAFSALRRDVFPPSANNHPLMSSNPHELVPFFEFTIYGQAGELIDLASFSVPRLFATHIPHDSLPESVGQSGCRVIYICRNPLDTIVSFCHFAPQVKPELWSGGRSSMEEYLDYCCRGIDGFGPFWDHMLGYWKASLERPDKIFEIIQRMPRRDLEPASAAISSSHAPATPDTGPCLPYEASAAAISTSSFTLSQILIPTPPAPTKPQPQAILPFSTATRITT
ncbi:hypothetical protein CRG98_023555 [Punica granatum]|uniref:Sulfotransferase n=1 Tax=Punica granatum TaxID=22663 RepID=A0A2I0JIF8_PUNGR|nr:hypothetical protein CRG98_023555 [Punica granatum]